LGVLSDPQLLDPHVVFRLAGGRFLCLLSGLEFGLMGGQFRLD
jgi:hypothetical protein